MNLESKVIHSKKTKYHKLSHKNNALMFYKYSFTLAWLSVKDNNLKNEPGKRKWVEIFSWMCSPVFVRVKIMSNRALLQILWLSIHISVLFYVGWILLCEFMCVNSDFDEHHMFVLWSKAKDWCFRVIKPDF